jgi:hypothetical protein
VGCVQTMDATSIRIQIWQCRIHGVLEEEIWYICTNMTKMRLTLVFKGPPISNKMLLKDYFAYMDQNAGKGMLYWAL